MLLPESPLVARQEALEPDSVMELTIALIDLALVDPIDKQAAAAACKALPVSA